MTATNTKASHFKVRPRTAKAADKPSRGLILKATSFIKTEVVDSFDKKIIESEDEETKKKKHTETNLGVNRSTLAKDTNNHTPKEKIQSPSRGKRVNSEPNKEALKAEVVAELESKAIRFSKKAPVRGLLLKQRKLLTAAKLNNFQLVRSSGFTYFEPDVNARDDHQNTPLYYAAMNGNMEFSQFLVDHGANPNQPCENGNTPLHMAFQSDKEAVTNFYLIVISLMSSPRSS